jgi:Domain of unknown function (DUF4382)
MSSVRNVMMSGVIALCIAIAFIGGALLIPGVSLIGPGTLGVQMTDPPVVPPNVTDVYISYSEIAVHVAHAENQTGWYRIAPAGEIDLMSILNTSITLGSANVKSGVFNAVGFDITSANVTVLTASGSKNETARLDGNHLIVPIIGNLQVSSGGSEGILIDLSPTVVALNNTSGQTIYVLIPTAHVLHIPHDTWISVKAKDSVIQHINAQPWVQEQRGNISLSKPVLTPTSVSVVVTNSGKSPTMISSLAIYYPLAFFCQYSAYALQYPTLYPNICPMMGTQPMEPVAPQEIIPIAYFAILSNGSLFQYNFTTIMLSRGGAIPQTSTMEALPEPHIGYVLAAGQSVTLTFNGRIATINSNILDYLHVSAAVTTTLITSLSTIIQGQQYLMVVRGPFYTFAETKVTAG